MKPNDPKNRPKETVPPHTPWDEGALFADYYINNMHTLSNNPEYPTPTPTFGPAMPDEVFFNRIDAPDLTGEEEEDPPSPSDKRH